MAPVRYGYGRTWRPVWASFRPAKDGWAVTCEAGRSRLAQRLILMNQTADDREQFRNADARVTIAIGDDVLDSLVRAACSGLSFTSPRRFRQWHARQIETQNHASRTARRTFQPASNIETGNAAPRVHTSVSRSSRIAVLHSRMVFKPSRRPQPQRAVRRTPASRASAKSFDHGGAGRRYASKIRSTPPSAALIGA
jgi:hypothetical protein